MATAQFDKAAVIVAATKKREELLTLVAENEREKRQELEREIDRLSSPRWFRPWPVSRESVAESAWNNFFWGNLFDRPIYTLRHQLEVVDQILTLANADTPAGTPHTISLNGAEADLIGL